MKKLLLVIGLGFACSVAFGQAVMVRAPKGTPVPPEMKRSGAEAEKAMAEAKVVVPISMPEVSVPNRHSEVKRMDRKFTGAQGAGIVANAGQQAMSASQVVKTAKFQQEQRRKPLSMWVYLVSAALGLGLAFWVRNWLNRIAPSPGRRRKMSRKFEESPFDQSFLR